MTKHDAANILKLTTETSLDIMAKIDTMTGETRRLAELQLQGLADYQARLLAIINA